MSNSRLVYSTETGKVCPRCSKAASQCNCKTGKGKTAPKKSPFPDDGIVRIQRETRGRKGKTVTAVFGVPLADRELKDFAKTLKSRCGTGGSIKDGVIIIQGDHRDTLLEVIKNEGYTAKIAGG